MHSLWNLRIAELYLIEAEIRGKPPHERQQVRQSRARPLLDDFDRWLRTMLEKLSLKLHGGGKPVRVESVACTAAQLHCCTAALLRRRRHRDRQLGRRAGTARCRHRSAQLHVRWCRQRRRACRRNLLVDRHGQAQRC
jgi:hypothetical protein